MEILEQANTGEVLKHEPKLSRLDKFKRSAENRLNRVAESERLSRARRAIAKAAEQGKIVAEATPRAIDTALTNSRNSRLTAEREGGPANGVQRFFDRSVVGWLAKSATEAVPIGPIYGLGDILTLGCALTGKDILTGRKLDKVDRVLYLVATAIPWVPGTFIADPIRAIRAAVEDAHYANRSGDALESLTQIRRAANFAKDVWSQFKKARGK